MKVCSHCKHENPSAAKFCMACGTLFIEEEPKKDSDILKKELDEVKKEIEQLKISMNEVSCNTEQTDDNAEDLLLQKQIEDSNETIKKLSVQIDKQKNKITYLTKQLEEEKEIKKSGKWGWIFVSLWLISAIVSFWYWDCYVKQKSMYNHLRDNFAELQKNHDTLQKAYSDLQNSHVSLVAKYPMIVKSVEIVNTDLDKWKGENKRKREYYRQTLQVSYDGLVDAEIQILFRWYRDDNYYCSFTETQSVKTGNQVMEIYQQDKIMNNKWPIGTYRIEIWSNGVELGAREFENRQERNENIIKPRQEPNNNFGRKVVEPEKPMM